MKKDRNVCRNEEGKQEKITLIEGDESVWKIRGASVCEEILNSPDSTQSICLVLSFTGFDACRMATGSSQPPGSSEGNVILLISPDTVLQHCPALQKSLQGEL